MNKILISVSALALLVGCATADTKPVKLAAAVETTPLTAPVAGQASGTTVTAPPAVTPLFPILLHAPNNGPTIAQINSDGTITGDKKALTLLLAGMTGNPTPESVIFALVNKVMTDAPAPAVAVPPASPVK